MRVKSESLTQQVEYRTFNPDVVGSNPSRLTKSADVAQQAEQRTCNAQVDGSSPSIGSIISVCVGLAKR